ncbi:MAG: ribulose-phosphate 3-epimerase [Lachnospiraceae bacterium]|nr:ribulose-phosphate 3-epimerase [Lachnospiraceae bacterium]
MREKILAPSILAADFTKLGEQIKEVEKAGAKYLHFDVMDGMFVPSISFGMPVLQTIRKASDMIYDVHLMIEKPERYIEVFAEYGADILTVHVETIENNEILKKINELGVKVGLSLNPETPIETVYPYLEYVDMVLVMTVHPGFGGQKYIDDCTDKVAALFAEIQNRNLEVDIEVDGGISMETIHKPLNAGANVIVAGSAVFTDTPFESAKMLLERIKQ